MVYDITTLNGSLMQLAETMATNLNGMGVIDAIPSDGLTTLAGKILDISRASNCNLLTFTIDGNVGLDDFDVTNRNDLTVLWGDEIYSTYTTGVLAHNYNDGETEHSIRILGEITHINDDCFAECTGLKEISIPSTVETIGDYCFYACTSLTNAIIPSSVISMGEACFEGCTSLTSVIIPETITSLGGGCFSACNNLNDYQLYWVDDAIIPYNSQTMPNNQDTIFTIPVGSKQDYIDAGYPANKLVERNYDITLSSNNPVIAIGDSTSVDILLSRDELPYPNQVLSYMVKHGDNVIDSGVVTTDSMGEASINYTGTGIGDVTFIVSFEKYGMILQKTYVIEDCIDYQKMIDNSDESKWIIPSEVTSSSIFGYSSNGWKYGNVSSYSNMILDVLIILPVAIEFELTDFNHNTRPSPVVNFMDSTKTNVQVVWYNESPSNARIIFDGATLNQSVKANSVYRMELRADNVKLFEDGLAIASKSKTLGEGYLLFGTGDNRMAQIKNLKIKKL